MADPVYIQETLGLASVAHLVECRPKSRVCFPFKADAQVAGSTPGSGCMGGSRSTEISLSSPLHSTLREKKKNQ